MNRDLPKFNLKDIVIIFSILGMLVSRMGANRYYFLKTIFELFLLLFLYFKCVKKFNIKRIRLNSIFLSIPISFLDTHSFYERWIFDENVETILNGIIKIVDKNILLSMITLVLFFLSLIFYSFLLTFIIKLIDEVSEINNHLGNVLFIVFISFFIVLMVQITLDASLSNIGYLNIIKNSIIVMCVVSGFYLIIGKLKISLILINVVFFIFSTSNYYIYIFRDRLLEPGDLFSLGTATNVLSGYNFYQPSIYQSMGILLFAGIILTTTIRPNNNEVKKRQRWFITFLTLLLFISTFDVETHHWNKDAALINGVILDFVGKIKENIILKPNNYVALLNEIEDKNYTVLNNIEQSKPNIIVIMNESFSDLSVLSGFETSEPVTPFISSLSENTLKGFALSSVYGGNTSCSEFEFLTGNSMAFLPNSSVPYSQYIKPDMFSVASYLKESYDYECIALHPYLRSGWNREEAYEKLGFDYFISQEGYPGKNKIREFISDHEMCEKIVSLIENKEDKPLFLFNVSMQNHGAYYYSKKDFDNRITIEGIDECYDVEQYLTLLNETDKSMEYLLNRLKAIDEKIVLVFFGDHQPKLNDGFYKQINYVSTNDLNEQEKIYKVPFFIWTNFESEKKAIELTSINYLSTYMYEIAGIPLPKYNLFLKEIEHILPSINALGYLSNVDKTFYFFADAKEEEKTCLSKYEVLQYNNMFDKNRSVIFSSE